MCYAAVSILVMFAGPSRGQPIYVADPNDPWNQVHSLLFATAGASRLLQEPAHSRLTNGLEGVRLSARSRPPLARAIMQADLWSTYDTLYALAGRRPGASRVDLSEQQQYARLMLPRIAMTMRALAMTREEINALPNTYLAAATASGLPNVFDADSGWTEVRSSAQRSKDEAAAFRRSSRVFVNVATGHDRAVAIVTQLLLVARDGTVVTSPIVYEARFQRSADDARPIPIPNPYT